MALVGLVLNIRLSPFLSFLLAKPKGGGRANNETKKKEEEEEGKRRGNVLEKETKGEVPKGGRKGE